jgi:L-aminopeptidase/D-esterase-like protein
VSGVAGLRIGHATDREARTGCTVLLGPFRAAGHVCGHATGSRELDVLSSLHLVQHIDALLLTGGSAFGLAAADGVVAWLEERGIGFDTGVARVPIVPSAVIFDLGTGRADRRPDAAMGRAACDAASGDLPAEGAVGAGTGATSGKVGGRDGARPGGFGRAVVDWGGHAVLGAVVVNPLGYVRDESGRIAGAPEPGGPGGVAGPFVDASPPGTNTTLAVVVTDAPLPRDALGVVARMASAAIARRIDPAFTPFDGDIVFALSTALEASAAAPAQVAACGVAACAALEQAILRAVAGPR